MSGDVSFGNGVMTGFYGERVGLLVAVFLDGELDRFALAIRASPGGLPEEVF